MYRTIGVRIAHVYFGEGGGITSSPARVFPQPLTDRMRLELQADYSFLCINGVVFNLGIALPSLI